MESIAWLLFILSVTVIVYHHVCYPLLLKWLVKKQTIFSPSFHSRHYHSERQDDILPTVCLIMPAHNEAAYIQDKLRNLATLDYPTHKLQVVVVCDGCEDDTAALAQAVLHEEICHHLNVEVIEHVNNRGKLAILNETIPVSRAEIIVLSDVSALISQDALLITAAHFNQSKTGVVCGSYHFLHSLNEGEQAYWAYQRHIKVSESTLGSTLGVHGAFYSFRRRLFRPLPMDTINDDFALPCQIMLQDYQCLYEPRIVALELEQACHEMDFQRRQRIAVGNVQQSIRHIGLLHPNFGKVALNFFSGKFIRPFISIFLALALLSTAILAMNSVLFLALFLLQVIAYALSLRYLILNITPTNKLIKVIHYIIAGHIAMGLGIYKYVTGQQHSIAWLNTDNHD